MSSKITIIAFNIIFHKYNYHQMLKIRKKIVSSFDKIDIFFNFSSVRNFNPVLLNFVYFIESAPQRNTLSQFLIPRSNYSLSILSSCSILTRRLFSNSDLSVLYE